MSKPGTGVGVRIAATTTIAPQLQQALHLLTLPAAELQQEIAAALERNPLLALADEEPEGMPLSATSSPAKAAQWTEDPAETPAASPSSAQAEAVADPTVRDEAEAPLPAAEADYYWDDADSGRQRDAEEHDPLATLSAEKTLQEHLLEQAALSTIPEALLPAMMALIEAIDDTGYLSLSFAEIAAASPYPCTETELEAALAIVQTFDPAGVGARSLEECLRLQLLEQPQSAERDLALKIVDEGLPLLARHDFDTLQRRLGCDRAALKAAIERITALDPKPGLRFGAAEARYLIPDLLVRRVGNAWQVQLNPAAYPRVVVSPRYQELITRRSPAEWRQYLSEARQFVKALEQRAATLVRVAQAIVDTQAAYFEHGAAALKPLTLKDIAHALEIHESTVSRVVAGKSLLAPDGTVVPLKRLFSAKVSSESGETAAAAAIQQRLRELIAAENPAAPLSDNDLVALLNREGIVIARRTVAKYRDALGIAPAKLRKRIT